MVGFGGVHVNILFIQMQPQRVSSGFRGISYMRFPIDAMTRSGKLPRSRLRSAHGHERPALGGGTPLVRVHTDHTAHQNSVLKSFMGKCRSSQPIGWVYPFPVVGGMGSIVRDYERPKTFISLHSNSSWRAST